MTRYPFSLERARALLAGLGLANRDADEWLEDDKGTEARFSVLTYRGNSSLERSVAVLRDDLAARHCRRRVGDRIRAR